ncbi:hypothetical protein [Nocardia transvalensis]|uniref:hypothetical protein n=1 Tax=Nocardia transvalensis TaxID=37333 RepID=UPI001894F754|nr:hypothetical protein [Nocardia transvalensis]MBF6333123.1 hypothetical protein [Nocardia transvalensis]
MSDTGGTSSDAYEGLSDDERRILRLWRENLFIQDARYESKVLLKLAMLSMADERFRARLLAEPDSVLRELPADTDLPENVTIRFLENTPTELNVVLPPRAEAFLARSDAAVFALRSRTETSLFRDDADVGDPLGDWHGHIDFGDPHMRDGYS